MMTTVKMITSAALAAIFLTGCVNNNTIEQSQVAEAKTATETATAEKDPNAVVCTYEKIVGKLIKQKTCYTASQREAVREASQATMKTITRRGPLTAE
jgi:PBP1b-binding outer membrane lipoprotein LpoB